MPTHWRAIAFGTFDGSSWTPQDSGQLGSRFGTDAPWSADGQGGFRRDGAATPATNAFRVRLHDKAPRRLVLPLATTRVQLGRNSGVLLDPRTSGGFGVVRDPIACKPAVMAETDQYVAFGSEYRALVSLPGIDNARVWEPEPATVYFWNH